MDPLLKSEISTVGSEKHCLHITWVYYERWWARSSLLAKAVRLYLKIQIKVQNLHFLQNRQWTRPESILVPRPYIWYPRIDHVNWSSSSSCTNFHWFGHKLYIKDGHGHYVSEVLLWEQDIFVFRDWMWLESGGLWSQARELRTDDWPASLNFWNLNDQSLLNELHILSVSVLSHPGHPGHPGHGDLRSYFIFYSTWLEMIIGNCGYRSLSAIFIALVSQRLAQSLWNQWSRPLVSNKTFY